MKRSDMIEVIKDYLDLLKEEPRMHCDTISQAEYILGSVETFGMLPPEVSPIPQSVIDNCESGNYWENEDE